MNDTNPARGVMLIGATFVVAYLLALLPGPEWSEQFRPNWVALVLIYWVAIRATRVGNGSHGLYRP